MPEVKSKIIGPETSRKHYGLQLHPLYSTWCDMKRRCNNPNRHNYKYYGGRGIKVCKRWQECFLNFLDDMGEKPTKLHKLERINNEGNYEPKNCLWVSQKDQCLNRRPRKSMSFYKLLGVDYEI